MYGDPAIRQLCGLLVVMSALFAAPGWAAGADSAHGSLFRNRSTDGDRIEIEWDREEARRAARGREAVLVADFPLKTGLNVHLELEPFSITGPTTRFVLGTRGGRDRPLEFDPTTVSLFKGKVVGRPGSRVFLALSDHQSTGYVDLGDGRTPYRIAGDDRDLTVFEAGAPVNRPPHVPFCGVETELDPSPPASTVRGLTPPPTGLKHLQLAVETDHELFVLFDDADAAMTYVIEMYAQVSEVYMRDVDTRVELSFVRLWDNPNDLFNNVDPSPLPEFRAYWNANMAGVQRDAAQLLSGRRDYPFGGQAYLASLCDDNAYSVVGYALGFFPDPSRPSPYSYDISVTAHELGHNAGTGHTHDSPNSLDTCNDPFTTPQRGTIMSYCGQTWSGGNSNRDLYFHSTIQGNMDGYIATAVCVVDDCNENGVADGADIGAGSVDTNSNGVPDECEDCNDNRILDSLDIAGPSFDVDGNGVPDECQPDCNGNNVPDSRDILQGTSFDAYGNDIPDECEADCDTDGTADFVEIQGDMTLDVDRDGLLDACEDCDNDTTTDLAALDGSHHAWVVSGLPAEPAFQFHPKTGVLTRLSSGGAPLQEAHDVTLSPAGTVLVTSHTDNRVVEYDAGGLYVRDLVPAAAGLAEPHGLVVTPDGSTLLVADGGTNSVLAFDVATGNPLGAFVTAGSGGLSEPFGLVFGPDGDLYVTSAGNEILVYDGGNGAFLEALVPAADNGSLDQPRGLAFKPDGNLLVASFGSNEVLEFDGATGEPLGKWAQVGTATRLTQISPWGVRVGPNGNVFVVRTGEDHGSGSGGAHDHDDEKGALHLSNAQIYEYDARNGNFLRTYVGGNDHGLEFPTGFVFVPGRQIDCNANFEPDACDLLSGTSVDLDADTIPDECQIDCNSNGVPDVEDLIPEGDQLDCNSNGVPDSCDTAGGFSADCTGNGVPDECERDCNGNGIADSCDLADATSDDCDGNGIPDECEISDDLETDTGWTGGVAGDTATSGIWARVDPNGTIAQPEFDHTPGAGTTCFVTGQGPVGGNDGDHDVDNGRTTLLSPLIDVSADPDAEIGYWRWFSNDQGGAPAEDTFTVEVSDDAGASWSLVETVGPADAESSGGWFFHNFRVADFATATTEVQLRFVASDEGSASLVEAAVDDLMIVAQCCPAAPPGEVADLLVDGAGATQLSWTPLGAGNTYDIAGGDVDMLRANGSVGDAECLVDGEPATTWIDARPAPATGSGYYYLVRADDNCAVGSYGSATAGGERLPGGDCP